MVDRRDPEQRLQHDLRRLKLRVRSLEQERVEYVERFLTGRLKHPEDFDRFIGLATVEDDTGRIDWFVFEQRLARLLHDRPELAA